MQIDFPQKAQERCESQARTLISLEERCSSLKSTIEQLNGALEKASVTESEMKAEINHMHRSLIEVNAHSQNDTDKIKQVICFTRLYQFSYVYSSNYANTIIYINSCRNNYRARRASAA